MESDNRGQPSTHNTGTTVGLDALAVRFGRLARSLQQEDDPYRMLEQVVQAAIEMVPGCDEGSISVVQGRRKVSSRAASSELPQVVDALQEQTGQGPCIDAAYEHLTVRVADMASEQRWPQFTARALEAGAAGMLSIQLYVEGDNLGALNLFSRTANAFTDQSEHVGLILAAHAALAYKAAHNQSNMSATVASRHLIGQAQGMLMERHNITGTESFDLLVQASQDSNVKLREVAQRLVDGGELPA